MPSRMKTFDIPHKGLRNLLGQVNYLAGNTDFSQPDQVKHLHQTGHDLFHLLTEHAKGEDEFLLSALEQRCPGASQHNSDDHVVIEQQQAELEKMLDELAVQAERGQADDTLATRFYTELNRFHSAYLLHMLEEETETQNLLWEHFTDEDLMGITQQIVAHIPPGTMMLWFQYSIPALIHAERLNWLRGVKAGAPEPVFKQIVESLKPVLPVSEFVRLEQELSGL
jgi:hypothetical protein